MKMLFLGLLLSASQIESSYLFPHFVNGKVRFRNGTSREAMVNYNTQDGQMRFLNAAGDTLVFTSKFLIAEIEIGSRLFVLSGQQPDMEVIANAGRSRLAVARRPEAVGTGLSHSGQRFSASAGGNASSGLMVTNRDGQFQWQNNAPGHRWDVRATYYLIDQNEVMHPASRQAFIHVFARHRRAVLRFIRENRIDFRRESDLLRLLAYCADLTALYPKPLVRTV